MQFLRRRYTPRTQPTISAVSPSSASPSGGSVHVISGSFLETTTTVLVGGTSVSFTAASTRVTFTLPAIATETYPVEVITSGGSSRLYPGLFVLAVNSIQLEDGTDLLAEDGTTLQTET